MEDVRIDGLLRYHVDEHSFSFDVSSPADLAYAMGDEDVTSVVIGTLQIEVGVSTHRAMYVWGYHPRSAWEERPLPRPSTRPGGVIIAAPEIFEMGVSEPVPGGEGWKTVFDPSNGWVRVAPDEEADDEMVEVATGVVLGRRGQELHSVWLHPVYEDGADVY
ncbi:hypothetical protein AB0M95_17120 [Sphaerisporangium sp. NPDC051017]|uniref:hypothetical protein n=1 Tax=Sphaerisporangium sp. NPDC051017 TaxID=3154636 RepID=UPI00343A9252